MGIVIFRTKLNFYICLIRSSFSGDHRVIVACDNAATLIACLRCKCRITDRLFSEQNRPLWSGPLISRSQPSLVPVPWSPLVWSTNIKISAISGPGPLVPWSPGPLFSTISAITVVGPLVPWSPGPLFSTISAITVAGPLVPWSPFLNDLSHHSCRSPGPLVPWSPNIKIMQTVDVAMV